MTDLIPDFLIYNSVADRTTSDVVLKKKIMGNH